VTTIWRSSSMVLRVKVPSTCM